MSELVLLTILLFMGNPSQCWGASPPICDHTVLPTTWHRWNCFALILPRQAGTWFSYPRGMEGWVDLGVGYILRWFTCRQIVTHPTSNRLIAIWLKVEPTTLQLQVQRPAVTLPSRWLQNYFVLLCTLLAVVYFQQWLQWLASDLATGWHCAL